MATTQLIAWHGVPLEIVACNLSAEVMAKLVAGDVDAAVLPIENSLHGSVAEHYDLLLAQPVRIVRESSMRVRHNVIAAPGVRLEEIRKVLSHPVALSQCRRWLGQHPQIFAAPFYDTAGGVKYVMAEGLRDTAAIAPALAAEAYGADVLCEGVEDHAENYTRFLLVVRQEAAATLSVGAANKMSIAFAVEHRPGTLVRALERLAAVGADLTKIESRPVPGRPWEYVFYIDFRFRGAVQADAAVAELRAQCGMVKELGRYAAADQS